MFTNLFLPFIWPTYLFALPSLASLDTTTEMGSYDSGPDQDSLTFSSLNFINLVDQLSEFNRWQECGEFSPFCVYCFPALSKTRCFVPHQFWFRHHFGGGFVEVGRKQTPFTTGVSPQASKRMGLAYGETAVQGTCAEYPESRTTRSFASCSLQGVWCMARALPASTVGNLLNDESLRISASLRLGAPICQPHECICKAAVDTSGQHGFSCKQNKGRLSRHNLTNETIRRSLVTAGILSALEPVGLTRDDRKRHPPRKYQEPQRRTRKDVNSSSINLLKVVCFHTFGIWDTRTMETTSQGSDKYDWKEA